MDTEANASNRVTRFARSWCRQVSGGGVTLIRSIVPSLISDLFPQRNILSISFSVLDAEKNVHRRPLNISVDRGLQRTKVGKATSLI